MPQATRDLDTASNDRGFIPVGHTLALPALPELAAPRYTDLDQRAAPQQPRTRLLKDVLRVGGSVDDHRHGHDP